MSSADGGDWVNAHTTRQSHEECERAQRDGVPIEETGSEKYLIEQRKLQQPLWDALRHLPNARTAEGALIAPLSVDGEVVGVQATFLSVDGHKSVIDPARQTWKLKEKPSPNAIFDLPGGDSADGIVICDGLEDALTVKTYGLPRNKVIGLPGQWALKHLKYPEDTKILIVADGDPPGSQGAAWLQQGVDHLLLSGCEVSITTIPPVSVPKLDANQMLIETGVDGLRNWLATATPATLSDSSEIRRLATLPLLAYGKERRAAARKLGITTGILDTLVDSERKKIAEEKRAAENDFVDIDSTRPWDEEVDGVELLDELAKTVRSFVIMPAEAAWAIALWIIFTWVFVAAYVSLKLWIKSAEKRSGKSRLVEVLSFLVCRPLMASGMTVPAFYRLVDEKRPTVLMDEFDAWATENTEFRGILNAGFDKRSAVKWVCVGDDHTPTAFNLFCPQVIAGIGSIPDTVADRSLKIDLKRKLRSEKVAKLRRRGTAALDELAQKCARWADDNVRELMTAEPEAPERLNDRAADGWELLFAIADQIGEPWARRARLAATKLSGGEYSVDDESVGTQLLSDIYEVLKDHPPAPKDSPAVQDKVSSANLTTWLVSLEDRPWIEFTRGRPMTQNQLARQLRKFQVKPKVGKRGARPSASCYSRAELLDLCARHVEPADTAPEGKPNEHAPGFSDSNLYPLTPEDFCGSQADSEPLPEEPGKGSESPKNPNETAAGKEVKVANPKNGSAAHKDSSEPSDPKPIKTREQTLDHFRHAGDRGLGVGQMEIMCISDDLLDELIAEGLLEEFEKDGRRVRLVSKDEVASNGFDAAANAADGDPDADADDDLPVDELARRLKAKNPSWTTKRIAKELGQPESRIARYFAS